LAGHIKTPHVQDCPEPRRNRHIPRRGGLRLVRRQQQDVFGFAHVSPLQAEQLAKPTAGFECGHDHRLKMRAGVCEQRFFFTWFQTSMARLLGALLQLDDGDA
jgi:hypothetical protein